MESIAVIKRFYGFSGRWSPRGASGHTRKGVVKNSEGIDPPESIEKYGNFIVIGKI